MASPDKVTSLFGRKISEREDVEMNKKKLRPNVLLSLTFAVSVLSSNKSLPL